MTPVLKELIGIDLEAAATSFLERQWELVDEKEVVGEYGAHSPKSAQASALDVNLEVSDACPPWISKPPPPPWLCGHFCGKAFAVMIERLEAAEEELNFLL